MQKKELNQLSCDGESVINRKASNATTPIHILPYYQLGILIKVRHMVHSNNQEFIWEQKDQRPRGAVGLLTKDYISYFYKSTLHTEEQWANRCQTTYRWSIIENAQGWLAPATGSCWSFLLFPNFLNNQTPVHGFEKCYIHCILRMADSKNTEKSIPIRDEMTLKWPAKERLSLRVIKAYLSKIACFDILSAGIFTIWNDQSIHSFTNNV